MKKLKNKVLCILNKEFTKIKVKLIIIKKKKKKKHIIFFRPLLYTILIMNRLKNIK